MDILNLAGIAVTVAAFAVLLRQYRQEYSMLLSLAAGVLILLFVIIKAKPAFTQLETLMSRAKVNTEYAGILVKALGICFVTQLASDTCNDAGESAIASKIELAGKFAVLLVALPLFGQVANLAVSLMS